MLDPAFLSIPIAHRALHDIDAGRPENGLAAVRAAVAAGYGIEIDVQLTADDEAVVFHDARLGRMTRHSGLVRDRTLAELSRISLLRGGEAIPSLAEVLDTVAGQVPLLVEIKDQDGALGEGVGTLEAAVARVVDKYQGPLALMSFNPHSVAALQTLAPDVARGLTTDAFQPENWPVSPERCAELAAIGDYHRVGATFISHNHTALDMPRVAELKEEGAHILCWTIRSRVEEANARKIADNVTFEDYFLLL